jgi:hypothetical protein
MRTQKGRYSNRGENRKVKRKNIEFKKTFFVGQLEPPAVFLRHHRSH